MGEGERAGGAGVRLGERVAVGEPVSFAVRVSEGLGEGVGEGLRVSVGEGVSLRVPEPVAEAEMVEEGEHVGYSR